MIENAFILAQRDTNWSNLFYLLFVVLLPMLAGLGKWIRERSARRTDDAESLDPKQVPSAPPARPARRAGAPTTEAGPKQSLKAIVAEVLDSAAKVSRELKDSRRKPPTAPGVVVERFEQAVSGHAQDESVHPPRRPGRRPSRPPKRAAPPPRARRTKARSPAEEVRALKDLMEHQPEAGPALHRSVAWSDWNSLSIAELRRAIVLNEVLGPPIALRRAPIGSQW